MTPRPLACALAIGLIALFAAPDADAQKRRGKAKAKEPAVSAECRDFYSAANAGWLEANPLPAGTASISALDQLRERARGQQMALLDASMASPQGNVQKLLGDFWASGLDEAAIERDGAQPIAPLLERINAIRRTKDVAPAIAALHQVGIPVAFNFGADVDLKESDRHIGYFSQGGLGLVDPAFYTRTDADTRKVLGQYNGYVQQILALTGTPKDQLAAQAQQVIDLETRIAQASRPLAQLREPRTNYAPVPVAGLEKQYKRLQLDDFLRTQGVNDDRVSIANPEHFGQLDTLVDRLKPEQWRTYLRFRVGDAMAPYLAKPWRDAHFAFRGRTLAGATDPAPRRDVVLDAINLAAGPMLAREYVARHLTDADRARAQDVATQVRDALAAAVARDPRLSAQAKAAAQAKLANLSIEVGSPHRDLDFTVQPMGRGSFGSNMLIASTWRHREEMKRIGRSNADRRWSVLPQQPALAYDAPHNRLLVTAAMLQPPVLDTAQPAATHYGAFGALVGHELSRAIDERGRLVDAKGDVRDWWTPQDAAAWQQIGQRVVAQYGAHPYPGLENVRVNGALTRDINVADLAGVEAAWAAYRAANPGAEPAAQQAFFHAWAGLWPQRMSPESAAQRAASSAHTPGQWRTNVPLMNQPAFAEAFACPTAAPMVLPEEQRVRLWP